jgi:hypothetical protein
MPEPPYRMAKQFKKMAAELCAYICLGPSVFMLVDAAVVII